MMPAASFQIQGGARVCSVEGCGMPHKSKGYCASHAERVRRLGHPLLDVPLRQKGEPQAFLASLVGHVGSDCVLWPFATNDCGYAQVRIDGRLQYAHREICRMVHGDAPSDAHETAHSCGRGHLGCVNPGHVRWALHGDNLMDRLLHGTHNRGAAHPMAKLSVSQVREIRASRGRVTQRELAERFGVNEITIHSVQTGKTWGWLDADPHPSN